ncbi:MAG: uridine monophosphate kinase [candidate division WOR-3 bacterium]|nr:uridine monophosphate kinase [candidate division WOR-3 bacterium]
MAKTSSSDDTPGLNWVSSTYHRVLLKLSGEIFQRDALIGDIVRQLIRAHKKGVKLALVLGGGNIIRGRTARQFDPVAADQAGMLATVINGIILTEKLKPEAPVCHLAAIPVGKFVPQYTINQARLLLEEGKILVLSGGTGNPFFSTDSAAALRALELNMEIILKGTKVPGIFSADPEKYPDAQFYPRITYEQALAEGLKVMDQTAFALCREHRIPIVVFDINQPDAILKIIGGKKIGSW